MISNRDYPIIFIAVLIPCLLLHWMLPFVSHIYPDLDFIKHYGLLQTEYLFAMKTGTFPLNIAWHQVQNNQWAGMAGVFHPLFYITALLPGYATGNALDWNVFLLLVMLAVTHLALFQFLRKLLFPASIAFLLSLITVYSPRLLLSFSVGGAISVWPGYLLLCVAAGSYCLNPSGFRRPLATIGLSYWLVSSGYPEETYFSLLGTGLFILVFPFLLTAVLPDRRMTMKSIVSFWGHTAAFCLIGALLSAAFILPFWVDDFKEVALSHQTYAEACAFSSTISELISNFLVPLRSSPSGLLGGSPLLLAVMIIPVLTLGRVRIPGIIWLIWGTACFLLVCMLGDNAPVHFYVWKYFPLYSATRYANRVSMILPVLFLLLLMWLFKKTPSTPVSFKTITAAPLSILAAVSLLLTVFYAFFMVVPMNALPPSLTRMNLEIIPGWVEPLLLVLGVMALVSAAVHGLKANAAGKNAAGLILCVVTCLQLTVFYRHAPLARKKMDKTEVRTYEQFLEQKQQNADLLLGSYIFGMEKILYPVYAISQREQAGPQPLLARIYEKYINVEDPAKAYAVLSREKNEDVLVVTGYAAQDDIDSAFRPVCMGQSDGVRLTYNSNNRLVFKARAARPSFFMFSYHRTGRWRAFVNGRQTVTYTADGYAHAVRIPAGESAVEFRYWSRAAFAGMLISCLTLAGIGLFYGVFRIRGPGGYAMAIAAVVAAAGLLGLWYSSLYTGDNLNTRYNWQAAPRNAPPNLAYGKPVRASLPPFGPVRLNLIHDGRSAVDGGRSFASCFSTGTHSSPWLEIDLLRPRPVGSIAIYADLQGRETGNIVWYTRDSVKIARDYTFLVFEEAPVSFNLPPLTVSVSTDYQHWETARLPGLNKRRPLTIQPENPIMARYIRIAASGECRLCLNEVEVYPPADQTSGEQDLRREE